MKILQTGIRTFPFRIVQSSSGDRKYVTLQPHNCKPWPIFWRLNHSEACIAGVLKARKRGFGAREKREGCDRARERKQLSSPSCTREFSSPSLPRRLTIRFSWQDQPFGFHGYPFNKWGPDMCLKNNQIFKGNIPNSCCLAAYRVIVYWGST